MRIAILWTFRTDYLMASVAAAKESGNEVLLILQDDAADIPQAPLEQSTNVMTTPPLKELLVALDSFRPNVVVIAGWHIPSYRIAARQQRGKSTRVMVTDTQWRGTLKQRMGQLAFAFLRARHYEWALVPGMRQYNFVRRLGFKPDRIQLGSIPANTSLFSDDSSGFVQRGEKFFLFAGRLAPEKGIDILLDAYREYRDSAADPWSLRIVGTGPREYSTQSGVEFLGFLDPVDLAIEMKKASCFVLPSTFEPWGVVVHEAAAAGLPIIATEEVGSTPELVDHGINGFVVETGKVQSLSRALKKVASLPEHELAKMRDHSVVLAKRRTPEIWVDALNRIVSSGS